MKTWKQPALFLLAIFAISALFFCACSSSTLSTKTIAGCYNAGPSRGNADEWRLFLRNDYTYLLFKRPHSASAPWKLFQEGRWKASGPTLKLQTPSKPDCTYKIQGFAVALVSSKKTAPIPSTFLKEKP